MGVSEKLLTESTLFRVSCTKPGSPPRNRIAPMILIPRKVNATGRPRNSSAVEPPSNNQAAACQDIALWSQHRIVARRLRTFRETLHTKQNFDGKEKECYRQWCKR